MAGFSSPAPDLTPRDVRDYPVAGKPYKPAPLTVRYRNPGALEFKPWMSRYGATPGENGRYAQFPTDQHGYDAMSHVLDTYGKRGDNTVRSIVSKWAPRGVDNNSTDQYIARVASGVGVGPDHPLGPEHRQPLMRAMAGYEAGRAMPPVNPPSASASPPSPTARTPMAVGLSSPAPSDVPPPSNQQIDLWRHRAAPWLAANNGTPTTGWGALGRIASTITGSMWADRADRGAQQQTDHAARSLDQYRGSAAGMSSPAPVAPMPGSAAPPMPTASTPAGLASPAPVMSAGAPAIGNNGASYAPVAPLSARRPQIAGLSSPAPVSTGSAAQGATLNASSPPADTSISTAQPAANATPPVQPLATPGRTSPVPPNANALGRFDDQGRWMGPAPKPTAAIDVGEDETPYDFAPGQGRMNSGLGSALPVPGTAQGSPFAFDARNAADPFKSPPEPVPAPTAPITGLAAQTGAPRPQSIAGPQRQADDYQRRIDVLGRMMLNPLTAPFAQAEMQRLSQEMSPDAQMKRRQGELAITKAEEDIASSRRMQDVISGYLNGGTATGASMAHGGPAIGASGGHATGSPAGAGSMPVGTVPSGMQASSDTLPGMPPLSAEAARAQKLIELGGLLKDRAMVQAGQAILNADPTYEARKKQSEKLGESNAARADARRAGAQILKSFAKLEHSFDNTPDDILKGAIGPYATKKIGPASWGLGAMVRPSGIDDMTPPQAAAAHPYNPFTGWGGVTGGGDSKAWDAQNLFNHDVHGITTALIANAGKGLNMSDARQEAFQATMKDFMRATSREEAKRVLDHAKSIIVNDFGLTSEEADLIMKHEVGQFSGGDRVEDRKQLPNGSWARKIRGQWYSE